MAYKKQNFANGQVLTAEQLNHMEDGIVANEWTEEKQSKLVADVIAALPVYNGEVEEEPSVMSVRAGVYYPVESNVDVNTPSITVTSEGVVE